MIVDDRKLIIGSANLNDRSMLGYRDSELALSIEGPDDLQLNVIGSSHTFKVNNDIHQFRCNLFTEHFGLDEETVRDPVSQMFWKSALNAAHYNTVFYEKVFNVYPTNSYHSWKDFLENSQGKGEVRDPELFKRCHKNVKGHVVLYPYEFLKNEKLKLAARNTHLQVVPVRALF
jgi:phospholipase D1/2